MNHRSLPSKIKPMLPILPIIISILISIGFISSPEEYHELDASEQQDAHIIVEDIYDF